MSFPFHLLLGLLLLSLLFWSCSFSSLNSYRLRERKEKASRNSSLNRQKHSFKGFSRDCFIIEPRNLSTAFVRNSLANHRSPLDRKVSNDVPKTLQHNGVPKRFPLPSPFPFLELILLQISLKNQKSIIKGLNRCHGHY